MINSQDALSHYNFIYSESLREHEKIAFDELLMAAKWKRPCILFAIYRSEYVKEKVISDLQNVKGLRQRRLVRINVNPKNYDIPLFLRDCPHRANSIFSISGLRWGGGKGRSNAYHALNMHREYLVEYQTLSVFWLTQFEARQVTRFAPDFWAFRHSVVEFLDTPIFDSGTSGSGAVYIGGLLETYMELLQKNPGDIKVLKSIVREYYAAKCYDDAILYCKRTLRMNPQDNELLVLLAEIYTARKKLLPSTEGLHSEKSINIDL